MSTLAIWLSSPSTSKWSLWWSTWTFFSQIRLNNWIIAIYIFSFLSWVLFIYSSNTYSILLTNNSILNNLLNPRWFDFLIYRKLSILKFHIIRVRWSLFWIPTYWLFILLHEIFTHRCFKHLINVKFMPFDLILLDLIW